MEGTYTKQCGTQYTFIHDSMFEICALHYGQQFPEQMLEYMSSSYIANFVKLQISGDKKEKQSGSQSVDGSESDGKKSESSDDSNGKEKSFDLCIRLKEDQYILLAKRLYRDVKDMKMDDVFRNEVLKDSQVCQEFISVLEEKSESDSKFFELFLFTQEMGDEIWSFMRGRIVLLDQREKEDGEFLKLQFL
jgi:hypothetical protein